MAGSYADNLPVFHLTGMPALAAQANRALVHHALGSGAFDLSRRMADTVVGASAIMTPASAVYETERLIAEALYNRRPVYMAFPSDVVDQPILTAGAPQTLPASDPTSLAAATDAVVAALDAASNACVLPGLLLRRLDLQEAAESFIETTDLPFPTIFAAKSVIDDEPPNS